jgi:hypothetical protein
MRATGFRLDLSGWGRHGDALTLARCESHSVHPISLTGFIRVSLNHDHLGSHLDG